MADINKSINRLLQALNNKGYDLLYNKKQFMGVERMPHNLYVLSQAKWDDSKHKYNSVDIYKTTSTVRMVLFLRDLWYIEQGLELPTDNDIWNKIRETINLEVLNGSNSTSE